MEKVGLPAMLPIDKEVVINVGVSSELIDIQALVPFDTQHVISRSLKKTNKIFFVDENVPEGGTAYMIKKVLEEQKAFPLLEASPSTLPAKPQRCLFV